MNPINPQSSYKPKWRCSKCGSVDVHTIDSARFDPNNDDTFVDRCEMTSSFDYCNVCDNETSLDEVTPPDDPWGHAYGDPMYWVPPEDDEYWTVRGEATIWTHEHEKKYWANRLKNDIV